MALRQRHTEGAILYEKKLKPFLKSLNEGKGTFLLCDLGQVAALPGVPAWTGMRAWLSSVQATFPELTVPAGSCVSLVHIQAQPLGLGQGCCGFSWGNPKGRVCPRSQKPLRLSGTSARPVPSCTSASGTAVDGGHYRISKRLLPFSLQKARR